MQYKKTRGLNTSLFGSNLSIINSLKRQSTNRAIKHSKYNMYNMDTLKYYIKFNTLQDLIYYLKNNTCSPS